MDKFFQDFFSWGSRNESMNPAVRIFSFGSNSDDPNYQGDSGAGIAGGGGLTNPRDSMLKTPESFDGRSSSQPQRLPTHDHHSGLQVHPFSEESPPFEDRNDNSRFFNPFEERGSNPSPFAFQDPFAMMSDILKSLDEFGQIGQDDGFFEGFRGNDDSHDFPKMIEPPSDENKKDSDIDSTSDNAKLFLKESPSYKDTPRGMIDGPFGSAEQEQPRVNHSFKSTSIIRVRKPDGTMEETRKYTDSTGVEKVTVTTTEPSHDQQNQIPSLPDFGGGNSYGMGSIFPFNPLSIFRW